MRAATTIALLFVIAVVVVTVCNRVPAPEPQRTTAPERSMNQQPKPVQPPDAAPMLPDNSRHVADVVDAVTAHEANTAKTGKVFGGEPVVVYGRVFKIEGQADRGFVVFLSDVRDGTLSLMLTCHFSGTSKEQLGKLAIGQSILIRGERWSPSHVWNTVEGLKCELVTAQQLRAVPQRP